MDRIAFAEMEAFLQERMRTDPMHDLHHVRRVLHAAVHIARNYDIDRDVLLTACLLHDIGRHRSDDHARKGAKMAYRFLRLKGWEEARAKHVRDCIRTHSLGAGDAPDSLEAKILFDADKLDIAGALGVARLLQWGAMRDEPLYALDEAGEIDAAAENTFVAECGLKIQRLEESLHTPEAKKAAKRRLLPMKAYFAALLGEIDEFDEEGKTILEWLD